MRDCCGIFSDIFSRDNNCLQRIDARLKIAFAFFSLVLILLIKSVVPLLVTAAVFVGALLLIRIPARVLFIRLLMPFTLAIIVIFIQIFFYGETPVFRIKLFDNYSLTGYREGFFHGALIAGRILAAVSVMLFLSMTTPVYKLFYALRFYHVPETWVEISFFTYRYIFVFIEDAFIIRNAQKIRMGYSTLIKGLKSFGVLAGSLFVTAYDQSNKTYEAMLTRGYKGYMPVNREKKSPGKQDINAGILMFLFLSVLLIVTVRSRF